MLLLLRCDTDVRIFKHIYAQTRIFFMLIFDVLNINDYIEFIEQTQTYQQRNGDESRHRKKTAK